MNYTVVNSYGNSGNKNCYANREGGEGKWLLYSYGLRSDHEDRENKIQLKEGDVNIKGKIINNDKTSSRDKTKH
jgi:hypothetical protein